MARLILINGAPASGKSTLARRYAEDHPLTLVLDIDIIRGLFGRWIETPSEAGLIARRIALQMASVQLGEHRDVIVPQFLGRIDFIEQLDQTCAVHNATFVEIALMSNPEDAERRFVRRSQDPEDDTHRDATALQQRNGGETKLPDMYRSMIQTIVKRQKTHLVETRDGDIEGTYCRVLNAISES